MWVVVVWSEYHIGWDGSLFNAYVGARQLSLYGYERTAVPRLFQESSTHLVCYLRILWKKFETIS